METRRWSTRWLASALILVFPLSTVPLSAATTASISGQLVGASDLAPIAGARLHVEDPDQKVSFVSTATGADGKFDLSSLPSSSYRLSVESNDGLYVVDSPVHLSPGEARHVRLAVGPTPRKGGTGRAASGKGSGGTTLWSNPLTATLIVVGAAIVVGVAVDSATNDEEPASASAP